MRNTSTLVQIALFIAGAATLWFYVYPAFINIGERQDLVSEYDEAIAEAEEVNRLLQALVTQIDAIAPDDQERLHTYLPEEIDPISVQRDLLAFVHRHPVSLESLGQDGEVEEDIHTNLQSAGFTVGIAGTYTDIKAFLAEVESNHYPLHLRNVSLEATEGGFLNADLAFVTYAYLPDESE